MHFDRAGIGAKHAEREAHQRRLACPVLTEQGVQRARPHLEPRAIERNGAAEPLCDVAKGQCRRRSGHSPVGAATKVHGRPNVPDKYSASERTPSVSVA